MEKERAKKRENRQNPQEKERDWEIEKKEEGKQLEKLQQLIGYSFSDPKLLKRAMSHSSYANEHRTEHLGDNERLEFLGDSVLEVTSSEFLYLEYPHMPEGDLTKLRASLVCEPTLALCARELGLPRYLLLGKGEEHTGGRSRSSIVSDAMEALIGAIFLDGGLDAARTFVRTYILTDIEHKKMFTDSKTILQEVVQRDFKDEEVRYDLTGEIGPDHDKHFCVDVKIGDRSLGEGEGTTKKAAEQEAAYRALLALKKSGVKI